MKNQDVRVAMLAANLKYWQVAEKLGISDGSFSRKLRKEMSQEEKQRIYSIIEELKTKREMQEA